MKKLLVATSALVVAAPAFANDVTLAGAIVGNASTTDLNELTDATISTLSMSVSAGGDIGGNLTFGVVSNSVLNTAGLAAVAAGVAPAAGVVSTETEYSVGLTGYDVYADSALGKFNIGTSTGTMTDDDLTEMETFGNTGQVGFASGVAGFDVAGLGLASYLTYSNSFGSTNVAVTWGADGSVLSLGTDLGGFAIALDSSSTGDYALNVSGMIAGVAAVALEIDQDSDYDLTLATEISGFGVKLGTDSADNYELGVSAALGSADLGVFFGEDAAAGEYYGMAVTTTLGGMAAGLEYGTSDAGGDSSNLYIEPMSGLKIAYGGASGSEDLTFSIDMSF